MQCTEIDRFELLDIVREGVIEADGLVGQLESELKIGAALLGVAPANGSFRRMAELLESLGGFLDFVRELALSMESLDLSPGYLAIWDGSVEVFRDIAGSFERQDWQSLSGHITKELCPLLKETQSGLARIESVISAETAGVQRG